MQAHALAAIMPLSPFRPEDYNFSTKRLADRGCIFGLRCEGCLGSSGPALHPQRTQVGVRLFLFVPRLLTFLSTHVGPVIRCRGCLSNHISFAPNSLCLNRDHVELPTLGSTSLRYCQDCESELDWSNGCRRSSVDPSKTKKSCDLLL